MWKILVTSYYYAGDGAGLHQIALDFTSAANADHAYEVLMKQADVFNKYARSRVVEKLY